MRERAPDRDFAQTEKLFYRLEIPYEVGERPTGLAVRNPDFSINREKHGCIPAFVLLPNYPDHGIAEFCVSGIPSPIKSSGGPLYSWAVVHVPEEFNYFHSEVHTLKQSGDGNEQPYGSPVRCEKSSQVNKEVFREFRQRLSEAMTVIKKSTLSR